ncbi:MAG: 4-alpha-glucanotransferase [Acidimicrobiia bacterium]|nr:4-alpha-glucanotransferase [Acidimicrobiia bacterium]NNL27804.1 4-alpha-glucanotransferase [Acidimicrobiia bacterium]
MTSMHARHAGVVLHPTSLPGRFGIGDIGPQARAWIDTLADAGCDIWQVLPLGPTGYGDSPYQTFSSFAGNPYLISPDDLARDGLLHDVPKRRVPGGRVDYGSVIKWKLFLLDHAWHQFQSRRSNSRMVKDFERFRTSEARWLDDYAMFQAIKEEQDLRPWPDWPPALRRRDSDALKLFSSTHSESIDRIKFSQFLFFKQWGELRQHAHDRGVRILGDVPIFAAHDSADVWANAGLFRLKANGQPLVVAGVPPDYYASTGQLWGNPLYRWRAHRQSGFAWWVDRVESTLRLVDLIRLDHFRGFHNFWEIPAAAPDARRGKWVKAPGRALFETIQKRLGHSPFVAEDLGGDMPPAVAELREELGLPGMVVLQFGFGTGPEHEFLPHNYESPMRAVYTSTHDNDTAEGYWDGIRPKERRFAASYLEGLGETFSEQLIRLAWSSNARFAMTTAQDILGLGTDAKMNVPGTTGGNWQWRMTRPMSAARMARMRRLNALYARGIGAPEASRPSWT